MKVLLENFSENIRDELLENEQLDQYHYRQEEQEKEEEALRDAVIQKQKGLISSSEEEIISLSSRISRRRSGANRADSSRDQEGRLDTLLGRISSGE